MLSVAEDYLRELNPQARLECYGQEYNPESYAICGSDLMMKGQNLENIKFGDSFTADGLAGMRFDYLLANPPFGVEWKPEERRHPRRGRDASATTAASAPACRASTTARSSSCST